ncbi:hypothetical protein TRFO_20565 [Tritrichomonas foetus]|uniref:Uncharacterized protein n=1 Tax=Tritrichomonas foetus TaxID=1144522 RepID=A0A1J4KFG1_9EUKA|nr:hypothetical protein TRFO_20565 [Tritrichomonas foetus]|eukprot:OHT10193.1 hypothetical protein TRFO_20565 [Tritrichomonas foetus]
MDKKKNGAIGSFQIKSKPQKKTFVMKLAGNKRSSKKKLRSFKGRSRKSTLKKNSQPPDLNRTLEHEKKMTAKEPNVTPEFEKKKSLCV